MLVSRLLRSRPFRSWHRLPKRPHSHRSENSSGPHDQKIQTSRLPPPKLSLLEELFPEERPSGQVDNSKGYENVRSLPSLEVDGFFEAFQDVLDPSGQDPKKVTTHANTNAFKQKQLALLVLQIASKSLVDGDFRRITPRGKHIDDWTGPGDIIKVIPGRDPRTLEQAEFYLILFPNPAYARAYQSHVIGLHRIAGTYTPTSIESPIPLREGAIVEGEDIHALLRNYALCPPSQRIQLRMVKPPYVAETRSIVQSGGYRQLVQGNYKNGRSVLFWIDGDQLTASMIKTTVAADGRFRGLAWNVSVEKVEVTQAPLGEVEEQALDTGLNHSITDVEVGRPSPTRWILTFKDETEARRFIRTWHRKPFTFGKEASRRIVHTEFLW